MGFSGKIAITSFRNKKLTCWECFGKFRIFATNWALRPLKWKKK